MSTINWHLWCYGLTDRSWAIWNLGGPYLEVGKIYPCIYTGRISCDKSVGWCWSGRWVRCGSQEAVLLEWLDLPTMAGWAHPTCQKGSGQNRVRERSWSIIPTHSMNKFNPTNLAFVIPFYFVHETLLSPWPMHWDMQYTCNLTSWCNKLCAMRSA